MDLDPYWLAFSFLISLSLRPFLPASLSLSLSVSVSPHLLLIFSFPEADPKNYLKLLRRRKNSININAALCSESKLLHYTNEGGRQVQGFVEFMSPPFLRNWHPNIFQNITKLDDLMTVPCVQMSHLVAELNIREVDIWILDVEGAELSVLQGTDFENFFVKAVVIECDKSDWVRDRQKQAILEKNQFTCIQVTPSLPPSQSLDIDVSVSVSVNLRLREIVSVVTNSFRFPPHQKSIDDMTL
jgi:FkbM family methyltransferase